VAVLRAREDRSGTVAQLNDHCYPRFTTYTGAVLAVGRFALSWGFENLLGAIWLRGGLASRSTTIIRRPAGQGTTEIGAFEVRAPRGPAAG
jgi:hypothetical protein